ncbi:DUF3619 family protein [Janthinobacterium sp. 17J80-10]|uniref:DUF3619 family protein n=1 Tax=Janthinobacterium sp. 17J80-10 TaxID=2497863 RepID=UPI0010058830|nr:DUF3619 family protein [Janthinobacterium sp. 17J80-10]QAU34721.1 DUF3619 family protein [Janthinobacterium sp. 17J80-10]
MNTKDLNFAYRVKHALDQNLDNLPASTADRLASARKNALSRKKPEALRFRISSLAIAGQFGGYMQERMSWLSRVGVLTPLLVGALIFVGLYEFEQEQRIAELAELDVAVLADDLPVSAYVDKGFNAYLAARDD